MSPKLGLVFLAVFLLIAIQATNAESRHPRDVSVGTDAEMEAFVEDPTKVLGQMYDTMKKTIDSVTPSEVASAAKKMKSMGESVMKMGLEFANSMASGRR